MLDATSVTGVASPQDVVLSRGDSCDTTASTATLPATARLLIRLSADATARKGVCGGHSNAVGVARGFHGDLGRVALREEGDALRTRPGVAARASIVGPLNILQNAKCSPRLS